MVGIVGLVGNTEVVSKVEPQLEPERTLLVSLEIYHIRRVIAKLTRENAV